MNLRQQQKKKNLFVIDILNMLFIRFRLRIIRCHSEQNSSLLRTQLTRNKTRNLLRSDQQHDPFWNYDEHHTLMLNLLDTVMV